MPTARKEVANATAAIGSIVHVVGGVRSNGTITDQHEGYDASTNAWTILAPLPIAVWRSCAAVVDGKLYVFGGYLSLNPFPFNPTNRVFEYDPALGQWAEKAPMPTARGAATAVAANGRIHVLGGGSSNALNVHQIYDPSTNAWSFAPSIPSARSGLTATRVGDDIYVAGGYILSGGVVPLSVLQSYNVVTQAWQTRASMPTTRLGMAAASAAGKAYFFGRLPSDVVAGALEYDPATNTWTQMPDMPVPVSFMGAAAVGDGIFVIGGGPVNLNRFDGVNTNRLFIPPDVSVAVGDGPAGFAGLKLSFGPNPFRLESVARYRVSRAGRATIGVFDLAGRRVAKLFSGHVEAGEHAVTWDGRDATGERVVAGTYFARLETSEGTLTETVVRLR